MENEPSQQTPGNLQSPQSPQTPQPPSQLDQRKPGGYGKRPIWHWIIVYVILAAILYIIIYMLLAGTSTGY